MKKERVKVHEAIMVMITADFSPSKTTFSHLMSWRRAKKELASLTLIQETSQKELDWGGGEKSRGGEQGDRQGGPAAIRALRVVCEDYRQPY